MTNFLVIVESIYGQESPGWISLSQLSQKLFFDNFQSPQFVFVKLICQIIPGDKGRKITKDILSTHFHFQHSTKNVYKVGTIYKTDPFQDFLV